MSVASLHDWATRKDERFRVNGTRPLTNHPRHARIGVLRTDTAFFAWVPDWQFRNGDLIFLLPDPTFHMVNTDFIEEGGTPLPGLASYKNLPKDKNGKLGQLDSVFERPDDLPGGEYWVAKIMDCCVYTNASGTQIGVFRVAVRFWMSRLYLLRVAPRMLTRLSPSSGFTYQWLYTIQDVLDLPRLNHV